MRKKICLILMLILTLSGCVGTTQPIPDYTSTEVTEEIEDSVPEYTETVVTLPLHMQVYKNQISIEDYEVYAFLKDSFNEFKTIITLPFPLTEDRLYNLYSLYLANELGITLTKTIAYKKSGDLVYELYPEYAYSQYDVSRYAYDIDTVVNEFLMTHGSFETDIDKVRAIHDYIIHTCEYSEGANADDVYGVLFAETALCEGYAKTFSYLCNKFNIPSCVVMGEANGYHMWNKVQVDGIWYNIDVTWDDVSDMGSYDYFLISDADISRTHRFTEMYQYPEAPETFSLETFIKKY